MKGREGEWHYEVTELILRKTDKYGLPYSAICTIKIVNGEAYVIGLLSLDEFTREDYESVRKIIQNMGYKSFKYKKGADLVN